MYYTDDSLYPENMQPLIINAAPYGPQWLPTDASDIPVTWDEQVQAAKDCYNAGATMLHIHVRDPKTGKGSKDFDEFNYFIGRLKEAVPKMILSVGGSISFAPKGEAKKAEWLDYDTRHMLTELNPKPEQVTIAIGTGMMDLMQMWSEDDIAGTALENNPKAQAAWSGLWADAGPAFYIEHLKRLRKNGIQPYFMLGYVNQLEIVESQPRGRWRWCRRPQSVRLDGIPPPLAAGLRASFRKHHAGMHSDERDGNHARNPYTCRQRGQHLAGQGGTVPHGQADRADGSPLRGIRPQDSHGGRGAQHHEDRRLVQQHRRNAHGPWFAAEPQAGRARFPDLGDHRKEDSRGGRLRFPPHGLLHDAAGCCRSSRSQEVGRDSLEAHVDRVLPSKGTGPGASRGSQRRIALRRTKDHDCARDTL
jgi:hypothetical protein